MFARENHGAIDLLLIFTDIAESLVPVIRDSSNCVGLD